MKLATDFALGRKKRAAIPKPMMKKMIIPLSVRIAPPRVKPYVDLPHMSEVVGVFSSLVWYFGMQLKCPGSQKSVTGDTGCCAMERTVKWTVALPDIEASFRESALVRGWVKLVEIEEVSDSP